MTRPRPRNSPSKFQRYRQSKQAQGLKLLRIWVPDPGSALFREEAARQAKLLSRRPEEHEALQFIEAAFDWGSE